jgi:hypothetical protein
MANPGPDGLDRHAASSNDPEKVRKMIRTCWSGRRESNLMTSLEGCDWCPPARGLCSSSVWPMSRAWP